MFFSTPTGESFPPKLMQELTGHSTLGKTFTQQKHNRKTLRTLPKLHKYGRLLTGGYWIRVAYRMRAMQRSAMLNSHTGRVREYVLLIKSQIFPVADKVYLVQP